MKQNERLLVYAVTGFLAVILLAAVLFGPTGREAAAKSGSGDAPKSKVVGAQDLGDLLTQAGVPARNETAAPKSGNAAANQPNVNPTNPTNPPAAPTGGRTVQDALGPTPLGTQQPLVASEKPLLAMDLVAQYLGPSRRDHTVRLVRARSGDSLEMLVRRWCGARDPFFEEAQALNEELTVLRVGQEVCVPWVDDEVVLLAYEASKPKTVTPVPGATPATANAPDRGVAAPEPAAADAHPSFAEPGSTKADKPVSKPAVGTDYVVKSGDSLWKIADKTYGRQNAAKMIPEIKKANPDVGDTLRAGQKIVLPALR